MSERPWLVVLLGLLAGLAAGLYYAWAISPVRYFDTAPTTLREDYLEDQSALIALAYAASGDLERARARLDLLPFSDPAAELGALAQRRLATGHPESEARALAQLAADLGERPTPFVPDSGRDTPTPPRPPEPTATPTATRTPVPTRTPTPTPGAPFDLSAQEKICNPALGEPLIQVEVYDAAESPVPGAEVRVVWDNGQDRFFTGLKPEINLAYGDFTMTEGVAYTVQLVGSDDLATGLLAEDCQAEDGTLYLGSWYLRYDQPGRTP